MHNASAAGGYSKDCDAIFVASKLMDVVLYPLKSEALVMQAEVGHTTLSLVRRARLPSQCAQPVIEAHEDDLTIRRVPGCGKKSSRLAVLVSQCVSAALHRGQSNTTIVPIQHNSRISTQEQASEGHSLVLLWP